MKVIFCNLPGKTTLHELVEFAKSGVRPGLLFSFWRTPDVVSYEILEILDKHNFKEEFHGIITFASPAIAAKAIKALDGKKVHGKPIRVREYVYRSPGDQRVKPSTQGLNRPENRRRGSLIVKKRSEAASREPVVTAYSGASREHRS